MRVYATDIYSSVPFHLGSIYLNVDYVVSRILFIVFTHNILRSISLWQTYFKLLIYGQRQCLRTVD